MSGAVSLTKHVLRDLRVDDLADALRPATDGGRASLIEQLSTPTRDLTVLRERQDSLRALKATLRDSEKRATILAARDTLKATEADAHTVADAATDTRHAEYYTQILWDPKSIVAPLNERGWFTELMVVFRTLLLPGLSVLLPLFIFLAPIIIYVVVLKKPLSFGEYFDMLSVSLKKAMPSVLGKPRFRGRGGLLELGEQCVHIGVSLGVFVASVWNQISAALTMRRVVADMRRRAESVRRLAGALETIARARGLHTPACVEWTTRGGDLECFGRAWNAPDRVRALLAEMAAVDAELSLALAPRTCFVSYGDVSEGLVVDRLWHPGVPEEQRVYNSVRLKEAETESDVSGSRHVLLTGPNRGGKSTLLKSLGAAVLMGHTVGIAFARRVRMPLMRTIATALAPADILGELSLFESEIEFAKQVLGSVQEGPMFLMMDEIFHGTNAHEGVEAAQVFLDQLYDASAQIFSVVSTHYMDLPERYGSTKAQPLCMEATADPADPDRLIYTYRLRPGQNRLSSVREILRERGLLAKQMSGAAGKA
jgi:hypothetical protein